MHSKPPIHFGKDNNRYNPDLHIIVKTICNCGCGGFIEHPKSRPRKYIQGHNTKMRSIEEKRNQVQSALDALQEKYARDGRVTPLYKLIKVSNKYIAWRKSVFERDRYRCCDCGLGGYIEAHHIKPFAIIYRKIFNPAVSLDENYSNCLNSHDLFDINNGKTLCQDCHKKQYHAHYVARKK